MPKIQDLQEFINADVLFNLIFEKNSTFPLYIKITLSSFKFYKDTLYPWKTKKKKNKI